MEYQYTVETRFGRPDSGSGSGVLRSSRPGDTLHTKTDWGVAEIDLVADVDVLYACWTFGGVLILAW